MVDTLPFVHRLPHGIHVIDTGFHRPAFDACYLVVENGRGAFIDTGTTHSLPRLLAAVEAAGLQRSDVEWVIVTHVHLDHAGGAGALMQALPDAKLLAHPRGARHMIEPLALLNGARAVYGAQEVTRAYGEVVPVPAGRVVESHDGMVVALAGRPLLLIDTPGHARHHHCIWDERSRGFFTGDTFGLSYREFDTAQGPWLLPTTTPVQFEPEALKQSVQRMLGFHPERLYLTHYGCVEGVPRLGEMMLAQVDEIVALGEQQRPLPATERHAALMAGLAELYTARLQRLGSSVPRDDALALLAMDLELNAQGIGIWLDRAR
jgi:glyoxylase-like metal-dependent hydrolase (beta-lactamase superfamily II)